MSGEGRPVRDRSGELRPHAGDLSPGAVGAGSDLPTRCLRTLAENLPCQIGGEDCVLEEVTVSALALNAVISGSIAPNALEDPVIHLKNGKDVGHEGYACGIAGDDEGLKLSLEFQMPLDVDQIDSVTICGQKIPVPEA